MYHVHYQAVSVKHMLDGDVKMEHSHESYKFLAYMRLNINIVNHHLFIESFNFSIMVLESRERSISGVLYLYSGAHII